MKTIKCTAIENPVKSFLCTVLRPCSEMRYQDFNGVWKPVQEEKWEKWNVLAETKEGARRIAEYHFYHSKNIIISD